MDFSLREMIATGVFCSVIGLLFCWGLWHGRRTSARSAGENPPEAERRKDDESMDEHVILRLAYRFRPTNIEPIVGWYYRRDIGAWVESDNPNVLYVEGLATKKTSGQTPTRRGPGPCSKKADIETGEDMKGE